MDSRSGPSSIVSPPQVNGNEAAASSNPNLFTSLLSEMLHGISSNRLDVKGQKWNPLARRRFQRGHLVLKQNKSGAVWIGRFKFKVDILVNGKVQSFQRAEVLGDLKEYPDSTACPACTRVKTVHGDQPCVPRPARDQDQRSINSRPNERQSYWANGHPVSIESSGEGRRRDERAARGFRIREGGKSADHEHLEFHRKPT
jgi:hypothetical protein